MAAAIRQLLLGSAGLTGASASRALAAVAARRLSTVPPGEGTPALGTPSPLRGLIPYHFLRLDITYISFFFKKATRFASVFSARSAGASLAHTAAPSETLLRAPSRKPQDCGACGREPAQRPTRHRRRHPQRRSRLGPCRPPAAKPAPRARGGASFRAFGGRVRCEADVLEQPGASAAWATGGRASGCEHRAAVLPGPELYSE